MTRVEVAGSQTGAEPSRPPPTLRPFLPRRPLQPRQSRYDGYADTLALGDATAAEASVLRQGIDLILTVDGEDDGHGVGTAVGLLHHLDDAVQRVRVGQLGGGDSYAT